MQSLATTGNQSLQITPENWQEKINSIEIKPGTQYLDVVKMDLPSISTLNKGQETTNNGITVFGESVIEIVAFFGETGWSKHQLRKLSEILFEKYYHWSFAELKLFITEIQSGNLGKVYGNVSPAFIIECALVFNSDLLEVRPLCKKEPQKAIEAPHVDPAKVFAAYKDFASTWNDTRKKEEQANHEAYMRKMQDFEDKKRVEMINYLSIPENMESFRKHCEEDGKDFNSIIEYLGL